jgi:hypothetical protein
LNKGKPGELDFFRGAGVPEKYLVEVREQVARDRDAISKFEIARRVLVSLNEAGDSMITPRREILRRITQTESFEHCWPDDRLPAKGVVAEIRDIVNRYDSFTRMKAERDKERSERIREREQAIARQNEEGAKQLQIRADLAALFQEENPWKRGKQLEGVLNRLFALDGISVREAFHLTGDEAEGIVEQIDGVIALDAALYLVEMKWLNEKVGPNELGVHFSRVFLRHAANGLFISASGFTDAAIAQSKLALTKMTSILCELEEIVLLLERQGDIRDYFREKVHTAIAERRPLHRPVIA